VIKVEVETTVQMHGSDGNGRRRWWPATVSRGVCGKSEKSGSERWRKWIGSSPRGVHVLDKDEVRRLSEGDAHGLTAPARQQATRSRGEWRGRVTTAGAGPKGFPCSKFF
jgi:hypothetical protein